MTVDIRKQDMIISEVVHACQPTITFDVLRLVYKLSVQTFALPFTRDKIPRNGRTCENEFFSFQ